MDAFKNLLTAVEEARLRELDTWHKTFENQALRMECPDCYHEELLRQCDEMDRRGIITWNEWRELRLKADQAYLNAVAGHDYH